MKKMTFDITQKENTEIVIGKNLLEKIHEILSKEEYSGYFVICSPETERLFAKRVIESLGQTGNHVEKAVMKNGEVNKSLATVETLLEGMLEAGLDRKCAVVALGGGIIGDIATLVSGLYYRGVDCIQIPTTLLAQVDSSYGGKGGVNMGIYKNMLGVIKQPRFVIVDTELLHSLPQNQILSGLGEAVKYGIAHDKTFFEYLNSHNAQTVEIEKLITTCCGIKMGMVSEDPDDTGDKRIALNFGHTLGHAVERLANIPHGLAVSVGITFAVKVSNRIGLLPAEDMAKIIGLLNQYGLPTTVNGVKMEKVLKIMRKDKKAIGGNIRLVLLSGIGKTVVKDNIDHKLIEEVLREVLV